MSQEPHVPIRSCVGCRQRFPKGQLLRLCAAPAGIIIDLQGTAPGRGAYLCENPGCFTRVQRKGLLGRALRAQVPPEFWGDLARRLAERFGTPEPPAVGPVQPPNSSDGREETV